MTRSSVHRSAATGGGVQHFWMSPQAPALPRLERAEGIYVWDTTGRRYLDVTSGPVAVNLGHGNARVLQAMQAQAGRVCFAYPSSFESESNIRLGDRLAEQAGMGLERAFFVSSGSEAVEKCLQFARFHALAVGESGRHKVISRHPCYHGSTLATLALSGDPGYAGLASMMRAAPRIPAPMSYRPPQGFDAASYAGQCAEALRHAIESEGPESVLAFILEPVMGLSGGADFAPDSYYRRIRQICDDYGILLIYDESLSGAGRTGRFLAAHWWPDVRPDLVVLAKGIGGGYFPLAAFLAPDAMVGAVVGAGGFHLGHTHKASPLACAVGLAVLEETLDRNLIANAQEVGSYLREQFAALVATIPILGGVRGKGLLNAIEIVAEQATRTMLPRELDVIGDLKRIALSRGLLVYARRTNGGRFGDWLMMTPPLIATRSDIDAIVAGVAQTLRDYQTELRSAGHLS